MNELNKNELNNVSGGGIVAIGWAAYGAYRLYKASKLVRTAVKAASAGAGTGAYEELRGN